MSGVYTYITHALLLTEGNSLSSMKLPAGAGRALLEYPEFCRMGAISPDYPYLRLVGDSEEAEHWGNAMHHKYGSLTKKNIFSVITKYLNYLSAISFVCGVITLLTFVYRNIT